MTRARAGASSRLMSTYWRLASLLIRSRLKKTAICWSLPGARNVLLGTVVPSGTRAVRTSICARNTSFRRSLANTLAVGLVAVLVHDAGLQDVEDLLGVHVAAGGALAHVAVHLAGHLLEVDHRVHGIAVVHGVALLVHQQQAVEELEDLGAGLVDDHEDDAAGEGELLQ